MPASRFGFKLSGPESVLTTSGASPAVRTQGPGVQSPQPTALRRPCSHEAASRVHGPLSLELLRLCHPAWFPADSTPEPRTFWKASSHTQTTGISDIPGPCHWPVFHIPHSREASLEKVLWVRKLSQGHERRIGEYSLAGGLEGGEGGGGRTSYRCPLVLPCQPSSPAHAPHLLRPALSSGG